MIVGGVHIHIVPLAVGASLVAARSMTCCLTGWHCSSSWTLTMCGLHSCPSSRLSGQRAFKAPLSNLPNVLLQATFVGLLEPQISCGSSKKGASAYSRTTIFATQPLDNFLA
eukprot:6221788-Amphidinium_carterae.2